MVIAIISLLAAILFPVFGRARESARRSACLSNLKQVGTAFLMYAQDFDEQYPKGDQAISGSDYRGNGWAGVIDPYTKNISVFRCPSDGSTTSGNPLLSYAYNSAIPYTLSLTSQLNNWPGPKLSAFTNSAKTVLLFEIRASTFNPKQDANYPSSSGGYSPAGTGKDGNNLQPYTGANVSPFYATGYFPTVPTHNRFDGSTPGSGEYGRHLEGSNWLFADGHAKWMKTDRISTGLAAQTPTTVAGVNYGAAGTEVSGWDATFSPR